MYNTIKRLLKKLNQRISTLEIALFFRQLAALITAGIPIVQSCDILRHHQKNKTLQYMIISIKINLESGHALSWCLTQFPRYFDALTCHLIQTGEQSGALPITLDRIALHKEKWLSIKNKIKQALFYPMIVVIVALVVSITMLTMVIPRFADLFQSVHSTLPALTRYVIDLSECLQHYYWLVLFPLLVITLLVYFFHHSLSLKRRIERFILSMPYLGSVYLKTILVRFCRTLATTLTAGIPISESLKTIAYANTGYLYTQAILKLQVQITRGQQLHYAMQKQLFFPSLLVQMVKVGEESGTLGSMLEKIAAMYEADIDYFVSCCSQLLEPLIITILGVLIGGLVIAMYLPIFKLGTVI